jgi:uncharacterized protein YpmB
MVPQEFFVHISIFVGLLLLIFSAIIMVVCTLYLRTINPEDRIQTVAKFGR